MRILLFGTNGQVGWELRRALQPLGDVTAVPRSEADFDRPDSLRRWFETSPHVVVNAVAYTAVDQAETDGERALRVNGEAVAVLAEEASRCGALLIHYSTDYVFDGRATKPYTEDDATNPQSAYGRTKRAGETAIVSSGCDHVVLRTSWVFASRGKNFVRTILRLAGEREALRIVGDQFGAPTSARLIADCTAQIVARAMQEHAASRFRSGIFHLTASGRTSWHGLASHIVARARERGIAPLPVRTIESIATSEYPVPAQRPANSSLDTRRVQERFGLRLPDWTVGVDLCLDELWAA
jgi:dTDP-4-dehydrorhamnose reductase